MASRCTVLFSVDPDGTINPKTSKSLSNPAALDTADAIVMLLRFRAWPDEDMARFEKFLLAGKPIVALRTSTHAFNGLAKGGPWESWNYNNQGGFGKRVLGETWLTHWGKHKIEATRGAIEPATAGQPAPARRLGYLRRHRRLRSLSAGRRDDPGPRVWSCRRWRPDSPPADYRKARATDKQQQGVNDPPMPVVVDAPQQERQRHDEQDPDDDHGFGDGSGE